MKITFFAHSEELPHYEKLLRSLPEGISPIEYTVYDDYDDFISGFPNEESQAVIVARRGADGMECARSARVMKPNVPLIWLSDDRGFGVESYRIGCAYFSAAPITEQILSTVLARCGDGGEIRNELHSDRA